jgi:N-acetylmuramoyl-L-alanine amidase
MDAPESDFNLEDEPEENTPEEVTSPPLHDHDAVHFNAWTAVQSFIAAAVVLATVFTMWTPQNFFASNLLNSVLQPDKTAEAVEQIALPTFTPSPRPRVGLVAGHWGNDSGSVCADGLTEAEINLKIATLVQQKLLEENFDVDLLQEKDARLFEYQGIALVSIHNDSCDYINDEATGFKVAAAMSNIFPEKASRLTACLTSRYAETTGLKFHANTITNDMTSYHAFDEIHNQTTAAIIETGFLNLDRQILTEHTDVVADGVAKGILCFIRNEDLNKPAPAK